MIGFFILVILLYVVLSLLNGLGRSAGSPHQHTFTYQQLDIRILSLASAVIKSDGSISADEIRFVREQFITQFGQARAERAFADFKTFARKDSVEHICRELMFSMSYNSRQTILVFLFQVAASDGSLAQGEVETIARMADWMGIARQHFYFIYSAFSQGAYRNGDSSSQSRPSGASAGRSPYQILGVDQTATVEQIKQSYRILVKKYHPDRLVKYPPEEQQIAKEKFLEIQDAYERIKKQRGF